MNGNDNSNNFDKAIFEKVVELLEKDVVAWNRCYDKLEKIDEVIERLAKTMEQKISLDESFSRWIKLATGVIGLIATIAGTVAVVLNVVK